MRGFVEHPRLGQWPILGEPGPMPLATFSPARCTAAPAASGAAER
jgi:hypothetical protein